MDGAGDLTLMQRRVHEWAAEHWSGEYWPPLANLARLTEELGELSRAINQRHGPKRVKDENDVADLSLEFGDVLFVLACLANSSGVNLQHSFDAALAKYRERDIEGA